LLPIQPKLTKVGEFGDEDEEMDSVD